MTLESFPEELKHRYNSAEHIGSGGFAHVFKAKRNSDGKVVAVKFPRKFDEAVGKSFIKEIKVWEKLKHPNIVEIYDMNIIPMPYLELEYIEGGDLEKLKKPLDVVDACQMVYDIAAGIEYAHKQGIVHRDLKPKNILLTGEHVPKITDWGLSKVIAESKSSSQSGVFTLQFAAPEQVSPKKFGKADERTDIYQLGAILYDLITNDPPFKGDDIAEIASAIALEKPIPPSKLNLKAGAVEDIVMRCLQKKKEDRFQSAGELRTELAEFIKKDFGESLCLSISSGDIKRSALYCAELCQFNAQSGNVKDAMKYALDLKKYAGTEVRKDVDAIVEELRHRMENDLGIGKELLNKMDIVFHQVKMGWGKKKKQKDPEDNDLAIVSQKKKEQLDSLYDRGIRAANDRDWETAISTFQQVVTIENKYKDAAVRLSLAMAEKQKDEDKAKHKTDIDHGFKAGSKVEEQLFHFPPDFRPPGVTIQDLPVLRRVIHKAFVFGVIGFILGFFFGLLINPRYPEPAFFFGFLFGIISLIMPIYNSYKRGNECAIMGIVTYLRAAGTSSRDLAFYLCITDDDWNILRDKNGISLPSIQVIFGTDQVEGPILTEGNKIIMKGHFWADKSKPMMAKQIWNLS